MIDTNLPHHHNSEETTVQLKESLSHLNDFETVANVFKQLGDSSRLKIFWLLLHVEECVINISSLVNMSSPAVSHHLRQLKNSGLIVSRREGKEVYYTAADTEEVRLLHLATEKTVELSCPE